MINPDTLRKAKKLTAGIGVLDIEIGRLQEQKYQLLLKLDAEITTMESEMKSTDEKI